MTMPAPTIAPPSAVSRSAALTPAAELKQIRANVSWYRRGRGDPTTRLGPTWMLRAMRTPDGPATALVDWSSQERRVEAWGPGADHAAAAIVAMTGNGKVLDIPDGPHPLVTEAARRNPLLAAGTSGDLYHSLIPAVVEQRITAREALQQYAILVRRLGEPAPGPHPGLLLPPDPRRLARLPTWWFHPIGIERKRAAALIAVARASHHFWDWAGLPHAETAAKLALISGVGPWTIGIVMGPACGDDDAVAVGDYHLPNLVAWNLAGEPRGDDSRMLELLEPYRPQRGRVLRLLGMVGRRAPAFGPRRRILPMHLY